ncbi:hypothetical protein GEMRC1_002202 [Eukaryota sp. GEM-RC1]
MLYTLCRSHYVYSDREGTPLTCLELNLSLSSLFSESPVYDPCTTFFHNLDIGIRLWEEPLLPSPNILSTNTVLVSQTIHRVEKLLCLNFLLPGHFNPYTSFLLVIDHIRVVGCDSLKIFLV